MKKIASLALTLSVFSISSCSESIEPELNENSEELNAAQIVLDKYYAATQTSRNASSPQITRVSYKTYKIEPDTITEISEVATLSRSVNDSVFTLTTAEFEIDGTNGFAILSEDSNLNKVFYYTECGNPSDTTYNKGLAFIMNDIKIVDSLSAEDLYSLRECSGWKLLSIEQLERALKNTMCMVSIIKDDKCIACGRVVGDYSTKGVLSDILVRPDYQKNGYGKLVVTHLLKRIENVLSPGEQFQLEATPTHGNREFYVKCGMKYKPENQDGVYVWIKK